MKFKKLELTGFKSFFDKTTFLISSPLDGSNIGIVLLEYETVLPCMKFSIIFILSRWFFLGVVIFSILHS